MFIHEVGGVFHDPGLRLHGSRVDVGCQCRDTFESRRITSDVGVEYGASIRRTDVEGGGRNSSTTSTCTISIIVMRLSLIWKRRFSWYTDNNLFLCYLIIITMRRLLSETMASLWSRFKFNRYRSFILIVPGDSPDYVRWSRVMMIGAHGRLNGPSDLQR